MTPLLTSPSDLLVYECDGYTIEKNTPDVVVFPTSTEQVAEVVKACNEANVPFLPRGAGTSLAGGCLPVGGGVMITLTRMKRILEINLRDRYAVVEAGVVNEWLSNRLRPYGYHYAHDPSSPKACTIGGNVATNSGGPHTLKYGVTVNHVLGLEFVLPDGRVVQTGGPTEDNPGYDLTGVMVGSEGTFGIACKATVRITRSPEAYRTLLGVFETVDDATNTISDIIGAGIIPGALEMLDALILKAVEEAFHFGFPLDAGAVLIMEVDGLEAGLDSDAESHHRPARRNGQAREARRANTEAERMLLWKARKQSFGAIGRLANSYCCQDGVVPRTKLPHILREIQRIGAQYNIKIANVFHAGDGNIHPILLFDERDPDQVKRVLAASHDILDECLRCGGSVTGEHGIGVEKIDFMPKLFTPEDLGMMLRLWLRVQPREPMQPREDVAHRGGVHRAEQGGATRSAVDGPHPLPTLPGMTDSCLIDDFGPLPVSHPASVAELGDYIRAPPLRPARPSTHSAEAPSARPRSAARRAPVSPSAPASSVRSSTHPARDMTITVQAGITLARLGNSLALENQRLPIDVPNASQATLGGVLAVNVSGPRRYGLGTLRDYVIGISAVNDDGQEIKGGGRVVKNVAGYDLCKLYIGSLGTPGHHHPGDAEAEAAAGGTRPADPGLRYGRGRSACWMCYTARGLGRCVWNCSMPRRSARRDRDGARPAAPCPNRPGSSSPVLRTIARR